MAEAEERESAKKSFHERGSFKAAVAVLGLLGGIWALLGAPKPWEVATDLAANRLPLRNTEIILDASAGMGARFGKATKLDIAAEAVVRSAAGSEHVGLALRRVGGACDEPSEPLVGFDDHHFDDVTEAAEDLEPGGRSNLSLAVRSAIGDFAGEAFHRSGAENQIVIFAGGGDECGDQTGREIRNQLRQANIHPEFHVYAIDVSKKELKNLKAMKRELAHVAPVELDQADTVQQLYEAVQEHSRGAASGDGSVTRSDGEEHQTEAAGEGDAAAASAAEGRGAEAWSAPAPGLLEAPSEEEPAGPSEEEKEEAKELEAKELEEKEAEEELDLKSAEEAPIEEAEEDGEEGGSLGESQPLPTPSKSSPRLRRWLWSG